MRRRRHMTELPALAQVGSGCAGPGQVILMELAQDAAERYDEWYGSPWGQYADIAERDLLARLAGPQPGEAVLDVGCGTGRYLRWLHMRGLSVTGVDLSLPMARVSHRRLGGMDLDGRVFVADGAALPFEDSSFDLVVAVTSLEFMQAPESALQEMARVCRTRLFLGVLSRRSLYARQIRRGKPESSLGRARLYSVGEVIRLVHSALGPCDCTWRTALLAPPMQSRAGVALAKAIDEIPGTSRLPWGAYIGLLVDVRSSVAYRPNGRQRANASAESWYRAEVP